MQSGNGVSEFKLRVQAAQRGENTYVGKPCQQGHGSIRYTSSGMCVSCAKARAVARNAKIRKLLEKNAP